MTISRLANDGQMRDNLPPGWRDQPYEGWGWLDESSIVGPYRKLYYRGNGREGQIHNARYVCFIFPGIESGFPFAQWWDNNAIGTSKFIKESIALPENGTTTNKGQEFDVVRAGLMDVLMIGAGGSGGGAYHDNAASAGYSGGGGGAGQFLQVNGHEFTADRYKMFVGLPTLVEINTWENMNLRGRAGDTSLFKFDALSRFAGRANNDLQIPEFSDKSMTLELISYGGGAGGVGRKDQANVTRAAAGASSGGMSTMSSALLRDTYVEAIDPGVTGYRGGYPSYSSQGAGGGGGFAGPGLTGHRYTEPRESGSDWQTPAETDPLNDKARGGAGGPGIEFNFWGQDDEACAGGGGGCYSGTKGLGGTPGGGGDGASGQSSKGTFGNAWGAGGGGSGVSAASQTSYSTPGGMGIAAIRYRLVDEY